MNNLDKQIEQYTILAEEIFKNKKLSLMERIKPYTTLNQLLFLKIQNLLEDKNRL